MNTLIATDSYSLIVGAGATGLSVARYLEREGAPYKVFDTRDSVELGIPFKKISENVTFYHGAYQTEFLHGVARVIVSPGVHLDEKVIQDAKARNIPVLGDVKLFLEHVNVPVIGITGTNGKSTVTSLVGEIACAAGVEVAVGGNLGTPALDLIDDDVELYVLEVSSFQLESTDNAGFTVAANLNVSQDHLDRHGNMMNYFQCKQKVFHSANAVVYHLHDMLTQPPIIEGVPRYGFAITGKAEETEVQFTFDANKNAFLKDGAVLFSRDKVKLKGEHNLENVLAACAIAEAMQLNQSSVEKAISDFVGLAHRCEFVSEIDGIVFINDSKATNVGAVVSAIKGLAREFNRVLLIAGGVGKGQDFSPLAKVLEAYSVSTILFGEDADEIDSVLPESVQRAFASSLEDAVTQAKCKAERGDLVLFSPACASFDMFANYEVRGNAFKSFVKEAAA